MPSRGIFLRHHNPPFGWIATGKLLLLAETAISTCLRGVFVLGWRGTDSSDASRKARHEFRKSPPGKAGFCISGHPLSGRPPMFDQLQKRLAAATQAVALLQFID